MGVYGRFVLPHVVHFTCGLKPNRLQRRKIVPLASGEVLEIGFGSGLNLPHYNPPAIKRLLALEPSQEMWHLARDTVRETGLPVEFLNAPADQIPLPNDSVDTVLVTYTLCTIPDVVQALREARRILRPGGKLLFCEHGEAPDARVRRWQNRLNPLWRRLGGGCNLNRPIPSLIEAGGFRLEELSKMYIPGWKPASFNYWGTAVPDPAR